MAVRFLAPVLLASALLQGCGKAQLGHPSDGEIRDALGMVALVDGGDIVAVNHCYRDGDPSSGEYLCSVTLETAGPHGGRRLDRQYRLVPRKNQYWIAQRGE